MTIWRTVRTGKADTALGRTSILRSVCYFPLSAEEGRLCSSGARRGVQIDLCTRTLLFSLNAKNRGNSTFSCLQWHCQLPHDVTPLTV